jgi:hypothetical protein
LVMADLYRKLAGFASGLIRYGGSRDSCAPEALS